MECMKGTVIQWKFNEEECNLEFDVREIRTRFDDPINSVEDGMEILFCRL